MLNFDPNLIIPVLPCKQLFKYWRTNICKNVVYIGEKENSSWCLWNFKFSLQANYLMPRKKPQNNFVHWGQQHCQNGVWNLQIFYVIFSLFFVGGGQAQTQSSTSKALTWIQCKFIIFDVLFWGKCSTCPHNLIHILPADYLNCNWFYWKSTFCSWPYSFKSYPNIYQKWNWTEDII